MTTQTARPVPDRQPLTMPPMNVQKKPLGRRATPYMMMAPALIFVGAVFAIPVALGFWTSLHRQRFGLPDRDFVGTQNYTTLAADPSFWNALTRSLIFVGGSIVVSIVFATIFALTLHHARYMRSFLRSVSLIPWLISGIATAWLFKFLFNVNVGLAGRVTGVMGLDIQTWLGDPRRAMYVLIVTQAWSILPFGTLILLSGLQMLNPELSEAASLDGATAVQNFRFVTFPQLLPHIGVALVLFSFNAWNTFDIVLAMTGGGPLGATEVLAVFMYRLAFFDLDQNLGAAVMIVILTINITLSIVFLRASMNPETANG